MFTTHLNFCFALKTSTGGKSKDGSNLYKVKQKEKEKREALPKTRIIKIVSTLIAKSLLTNFLSAHITSAHTSMYLQNTSMKFGELIY
jgi:hypothetical protein